MLFYFLFPRAFTRPLSDPCLRLQGNPSAFSPEREVAPEHRRSRPKAPPRVSVRRTSRPKAWHRGTPPSRVIGEIPDCHPSSPFFYEIEIVFIKKNFKGKHQIVGGYVQINFGLHFTKIDTDDARQTTDDRHTDENE